MTATIANSTARTPAIAVEVVQAIEPTRTEIFHGQLTLKFANGTSRVVDSANLTPEILSIALMHGLKQKFVDGAAIARNTETGASATLADKKEAVLAIVERVEGGAWNIGRGEGSGTARGPILFQALQRMQPDRDAAELAYWIKARTKEESAALMRNAKLLPFIQAIQAERAAAAAQKAGVDSDALLEGLLAE